jgi:hypothetical protein
VLGVRLDLSAQSHDQHVDTAIERLGIAPSKRLQEKVARQHVAGTQHERMQQAEFAARQGYLGARRILKTVAGGIEPESRKLEHGHFGLAVCFSAHC